uniref:Uncharacterized protein n=1 Tax=Octopus bimaculoides TaxID=37653 RepID=A0A0L8GDC0_OCTBM
MAVFQFLWLLSTSMTIFLTATIHPRTKFGFFDLLFASSLQFRHIFIALYCCCEFLTLFQKPFLRFSRPENEET